MKTMTITAVLDAAAFALSGVAEARGFNHGGFHGGGFHGGGSHHGGSFHGSYHGGGAWHSHAGSYSHAGSHSHTGGTQRSASNTTTNQRSNAGGLRRGGER